MRENSFKNLIQRDLYFFDKTMFILFFANIFHKISLITLPRGFFKTTCVDMLKAFYGRNNSDENRILFNNLKICNQTNQSFFNENQGRFAVIHLDLSEMYDLTDFEIDYNAINRSILGDETARSKFRYLNNPPVLFRIKMAIKESIKEHEHLFDQAAKDKLCNFISDTKIPLVNEIHTIMNDFVDTLFEAHNKNSTTIIKVIVIVDGYDEAIIKNETSFPDKITGNIGTYHKYNKHINTHLNKLFDFSNEHLERVLFFRYTLRKRCYTNRCFCN